MKTALLQLFSYLSMQLAFDRFFQNFGPFLSFVLAGSRVVGSGDGAG